MSVAQRQVFELPLQLPDTQTSGQRSKHPAGFRGDALSPAGFVILRVPQHHDALSQLDHRDPGVVDHGYQHTFYVFYLILSLLFQQRRVGHFQQARGSKIRHILRDLSAIVANHVE